MKWNLLAVCLFTFCSLSAQDNKQYPTPEFANEIYYFDKSTNSLVRLEKGSSGVKSKLRMGGFGGSENVFVMENEKSPVQIRDSVSLSFVYYTGDSEPAGWEAVLDPSRTTSLYNAHPDQGSRKVVLQSSSGMMILGKTKESKKYTFSVRKIKPGYAEIVVDKPLKKGEYMFVVLGGFNINMDGSASLFAFEVE
jgi:hypothetical protein